MTPAHTDQSVTKSEDVMGTAGGGVVALGAKVRSFTEFTNSNTGLSFIGIYERVLIVKPFNSLGNLCVR